MSSFTGKIETDGSLWLTDTLAQHTASSKSMRGIISSKKSMASEKWHGHTPYRSSLQNGHQCPSASVNVIYFCLLPCLENAYNHESCQPHLSPCLPTGSYDCHENMMTSLFDWTWNMMKMQINHRVFPQEGLNLTKTHMVELASSLPSHSFYTVWLVCSHSLANCINLQGIICFNICFLRHNAGNYPSTAAYYPNKMGIYLLPFISLLEQHPTYGWTSKDHLGGIVEAKSNRGSGMLSVRIGIAE